MSRNPTPREIADGVFIHRTIMANLFFVRIPGSWVLIDAGLPGHASSIRAAVETALGITAPPAAVVLTHGHFDHVGSLDALLKDWNTPIYAHQLERPFLTGTSPYPPPDPVVGGGALALLSKLYPRGPYDFTGRIGWLLSNGTVPALAGWKWIHTPGHTAGHVSFYRERDRTLIAGDAVSTTKQESLSAVATQRRELHGPPAYYTYDWQAAGRSVRELAALEVDVLASGHGEPTSGPAVRDALRRLADRFERDEVPRFGRYVKQPAITDERGIVSLPQDPLPRIAAGFAAAAGIAYLLARPRLRRH